MKLSEIGLPAKIMFDVNPAGKLAFAMQVSENRPRGEYKVAETASGAKQPSW